MSKFLMISANKMDDPYPVFPLGASLVASAVKRAGYDVKIFDFMLEDDDSLGNLLKDYRPDYIGFSMRNVDNVNFNEPRSFLHQYRTTISKIKEISDAPVILGGTAYTIFPEKLKEYLGADYGISGPGEVSLVKLLESLERKEPPAAAIIPGEIDQGNQNGIFLQRDPHLANFYLNQGGMLNLYTKRGCPHLCMYCSYPGLEGRRYINRSPEDVVDEIEYLMREHSMDFMFITDSVFNDSRNNYLLIIEEMARRNISVPWTCYMRPGKFRREDVLLMKRTGLHSVEWGSDCSSDATLKGMAKNFTWEEVLESSRLFARNGVPGAHSIIFGGPGETEETAKEGVGNLSMLEYSVVFAGIGVRVFPDTGIFELAKREGKLSSDESALLDEPYYYCSDQVDIKWLDAYLTEAFAKKANWIYPWSNQSHKTRQVHSMGVRGPVWDMLLRGRG